MNDEVTGSCLVPDLNDDVPVDNEAEPIDAGVEHLATLEEVEDGS